MLEAPTNPYSYRILIVEDQANVRAGIRRDLAEALNGLDVDFFEADTVRGAESVLGRYAVDCLVLDFKLGTDEGAGFSLLNYLVSQDANIDVIIETFYFDARRLGRLVGLQRELASSRVRIRAALNRGDLPPDWQSVVVDLATSYFRRVVELEGLEAVADTLFQRRRRLRASWATATEAAASVCRVCTAIYGRAGEDVFGGACRVALSAAGEPDLISGKSGAVVCRASVSFGPSQGANGVRGAQTILKLGEPAKIHAERDRFRNVVAFGVPLRDRVEFLGFSRHAFLAGLCYGFAGGVFGTGVRSLGATSEEFPGVMEFAVSELFAADNRSWYASRMAPVSIANYCKNRMRGGPAQWYGQWMPLLRGLAHRFNLRLVEPSETENGSIDFGGLVLGIPATNFLGWGPLFVRVPATLVHGDMHGGNVLIEYDLPSSLSADDVGEAPFVTRRLCLIDFAASGSGPRCFDAAVVGAELRRLDVVLNFQVAEELDSVQTSRKLAKRVLHEREGMLLRAGKRQERPMDGDHWDWRRVNDLLIQRLRENFADFDPVEYAAVALAYAAWSMQFARSEPLLVRLLAWMSASMEVVERAGGDWVAPGHGAKGSGEHDAADGGMGDD